MCTRYTLTDLKAVLALVEELGAGIDFDPSEFSARHNAALTQVLPVVIKRGTKSTLTRMAFGQLLPPHPPAKRGTLLANARAETLLSRTSFRAAAQTRRCLIPADGFYEWQRLGPTRLPHYFYLQPARPFFFAGLWQPAAAQRPAAFTIVTTAANPIVAPIHDRMPVVLGPNSGPHWLGDQPLRPERLTQLCRPIPPGMLTSHRVDPRMNNARHEAPDCTTPVA